MEKTMTEPPAGHELPGTEERTEPAPRGVTLWEMAVEDSGRRRPSEVRSRKHRVAASRRRTLSMVGVVAVFALVGVAGYLVAGRGTGGPSAEPGGDGRLSAQLGGGGGSNSGGSPSSARATATSASGCTAQPIDPFPLVGATTEIVVGEVPQGSLITVHLTYPGGSASYSDPSNTTGASNVLVTVAGAPPGEPVQVAVTAGHSSCRTSFVPERAPLG